jgi:hypothetical protein
VDQVLEEFMPLFHWMYSPPKLSRPGRSGRRTARLSRGRRVLILDLDGKELVASFRDIGAVYTNLGHGSSCMIHFLDELDFIRDGDPGTKSKSRAEWSSKSTELRFALRYNTIS